MDKAREIAARYPHLRARLDTHAVGDYAASPERTFEFGRAALLAGIERQTAGVDAASAPTVARNRLS